MSYRDSDVPDRPYKGLMPYSEEDAPFFFGREAERKIITANLLASRLTLLYGASGVGKSSVLRAGVAFHLRQLAQQNLAKRGTPKFAVVVFSSWRDDPLAGLADRVQDSVAQALNVQTLEPVPPSCTLAQTLQVWTERVGGNLLIILDQFEQYFLYHPQEDGEGTFAVEFPRAVNSSDLRVGFLISIREDSLAKLDRFKGRIPNLFDNYLRIERLDREAARAAIAKPIEQYNRLRAVDGQQISIEPALVEVVLEQIETGQVALSEAGRGVVRADISPIPAEARVEAHYLQLVMTRLWDEEMHAGSHVLRRETLDRLGGAEHIVRTHLDEVMNSLTLSEQKAASRVFHYLVTPDGTKIAHTVPALEEYAKLPQTQLTPVLDKLSHPAIRILRPVAPPPDQPTARRYEVFHDVLAPAILDWRARYVQAQERAEAEKRAAIEASAREREAAHQRELAQAQALAAEQQRRAEEQAKAARRLRRLAVALAVVFLLAVGAAVFAIEQQQTAEARQRESERLRLLSIAQALAVQAPRQQEQLKKDERAALLARQAYLFNQQSQGQVLDQVDDALRTVLSVSYFSPILRSHTDGVSSVAFSPDGQTLASGSEDGTVRLWDLHQPSAAPTVLRGHEVDVTSVAFSPDGHILASASSDNTVRLWDMRQPSIAPAVLRGHEADVTSVAFSPDGRMLASSSADETVRLWDVRQPSAAPTVLRGHEAGTLSVAFSPDGLTLASGSLDGTVRLWDVHQPSAAPTVLRGHEAGVWSVAFSPDGQTLASGSSDQFGKTGSVRLWDVHQPGVPLTVLPGHEGRVTSVAFSPDGQTLASGSLDETVRLWDLRQPSAAPTVLRGHEESIWSVAFSPDGQTLASGSSDQFGRAGSVRLWDMLQPSVAPPVLRGHEVGIWSVAFSPNGQTLASGSADGSVRLWHVLQPSAAPTVLRGHEAGVWSAAFSLDGQTLASASSDNTVRLWDVASGAAYTVLHDYEAIVYSVAFSPDGQTLASGSADGIVWLWDIRQPSAAPTVLRGHEADVTSVAFSPDGQTLASGSLDETVRLWDLRQPSVAPTVLRGHEESVWSVAFSPDGQTLASGSADGTVRLWNLRQPSVAPTVLRGHEDRVLSVVFSPDGQTLASGSADQTIRIWIARTEILADSACEKVWRNLTLDEWRQFVGEGIPYERTCPDLPLPSEEVVIKIDEVVIDTSDDRCREIVCNSSPRIQVTVLDSAGVPLQPDIFFYNWRFDPPDSHNRDKLDSKNYAIIYSVPCDRNNQTVTIEVLKNGETLAVKGVCFNIKKQP